MYEKAPILVSTSGRNCYVYYSYTKMMKKKKKGSILDYNRDYKNYCLESNVDQNLLGGKQFTMTRKQIAR